VRESRHCPRASYLPSWSRGGHGRHSVAAVILAPRQTVAQHRICLTAMQTTMVSFEWHSVNTFIHRSVYWQSCRTLLLARL
jgi:hypothetical protein